jgi:hypothetical protein
LAQLELLAQPDPQVQQEGRQDQPDPQVQQVRLARLDRKARLD